MSNEVKNIRVAPISRKDADIMVKRYHYSKTVVQNSQLHFGIFLNGVCGGAMQFGPSLDKGKIQGIVRDTPWNGFIELNRMALADWLPKNSESRALGYALRFMKKNYPHIEWVVSFSDGTQSGDGTIYRATGFVLTQIKPNKTIWVSPEGEKKSDLSLRLNRVTETHGNGASSMRKFRQEGYKPLPGFQLRYVYFLKPEARSRLSCPELPFSAIDEMGARMYKGQARGKHLGDALDTPVEGGRFESDPHAPILSPPTEF